jgi:hypothetical protein
MSGINGTAGADVLAQEPTPEQQVAAELARQAKEAGCR